MQLDGAGEPGWFGVPHRLEGGLRVHHDRVLREHVADGWLMQAGQLTHADMPTETTDDNQGSAVAVATKITAAMRDLPGQGAEGLHTDTAWTVDLAAAYTPRPWLRVYATASNVFDRAHVVSYRPWGARPGAPRLIVLGVKTTY